MAREARDEGQMMLLTAILLILAFIALTAMVARVGQLGSSTFTEQQRPILLEVEAVSDQVDQLVLDLQDPALGLVGPAYTDALANSLAHLDFLLASQGFLFEIKPPGLTCAAEAFDYSLSDGELSVTLRAGFSCPLPPPPP